MSDEQTVLVSASSFAEFQAYQAQQQKKEDVRKRNQATLQAAQAALKVAIQACRDDHVSELDADEKRMSMPPSVSPSSSSSSSSSSHLYLSAGAWQTPPPRAKGQSID
jgi:hypothetical protein